MTSTTDNTASNVVQDKIIPQFTNYEFIHYIIHIITLRREKAIIYCKILAIFRQHLHHNIKI